MLSRKFRLRQKDDVNRVFKEGRSAASRELALKFLPNKEGKTRVVILVGKKLHKSAVARNRIRRRLREVARLNYEKLPQGIDLLVVARTVKLREMEFGELTQKYLQLVKRII